MAGVLHGADTPPPPPDKAIDYAIVVTGRELLVGAYADSHTQFLTKTLRGLGLHCVYSMSVDDAGTDIAEALRYALAKVPLVIVTGGLGPTENDVTRQSLAEFTGVPLREHPEILQDMEQRMGVPRDQMRANLRRQSQVPTRGTYLKNGSGSASGLVFDLGDKVIVALPGPPRELQPMVRDALLPYLSRRFGTRLPGCSLTIRFVGPGQSQIDQTMKDHAPLPADVLVSSQFDAGRVDFTFAFPDDNAENLARLEQLKQQTTQCLGDYIYAADETTTLEQHVVSLLERRGVTLAIGEAGSGGSLAAALDSVEGAERQVVGAYVARTGERLRHLLRVPEATWLTAASGAEQAQLLATELAAAASAPWAVVVGDTQRDDRGATHVDVVFRHPDGHLENLRLGVRAGDAGRAHLTTQLLDQLRRRLR
ncbi:MAG: molybdopterin-binding protein [Pirellulaceae bacterium]|nr:molybdopterin-binding protein [Pirellulaceae bacterium]MCU0978665.1 molybdopterin-binding protein [Pirellulaceae bacterium]